MQPAQRPTVPQDGVFLNHRMQKPSGAGWRPQTSHTCCPTDWRVEALPSRDNAVFGAGVFVNSRFARPAEHDAPATMADGSGTQIKNRWR